MKIFCPETSKVIHMLFQAFQQRVSSRRALCVATTGVASRMLMLMAGTGNRVCFFLVHVQTLSDH